MGTEINQNASMSQSFSTMSSSSLSNNSISNSSKSMISFDENEEGTTKFMNLISFNENDTASKNINEYLDDIYLNLQEEEKEASDLVPENYLQIQPLVNDKVRAILIDWIVEIQQEDILNFSERTLFLTIKIIDRYLSKKPIQTEYFQLLGIGALLIAMKHEEIKPATLEDLCVLTDNAYTREQLIEMELEILKAVNFQILVPTPYDFYQILAKALSLPFKAFNFGLFFMEVFFLETGFNAISPSVLAIACIYISMKYFGIPNYSVCYDPVLNSMHLHHSYIKQVAQKVCFFINGFAQAKELKNIPNKFSSEKYGKVAIYC